MATTLGDSPSTEVTVPCVNLDPDRALLYLDFVVERHRIFELRQHGFPQPWTTNPVLASNKYTNMFRWIDPGSQFVITDLIDPVSDLNTLTRCFLYRFTNYPDTWRWLRDESIFGEYPDASNIGPALIKTLQSYRDDDGGQLFSGAYMISPQSREKGADKIEQVVLLTQRMLYQGVFEKFLATEGQRARFEVLRANRGVGDFMAMQILTDFGYSTDFREDEFVVLGPGARKGAMALLNGNPGKLDDVLTWTGEALSTYPDAPVFMGRKLSALDRQNSLCEYSKYVRHTENPPKNRTPYVAAHPGKQPEIVLPPNWK